MGIEFFLGMKNARECGLMEDKFSTKSIRLIGKIFDNALLGISGVVLTLFNDCELIEEGSVLLLLINRHLD